MQLEAFVRAWQGRGAAPADFAFVIFDFPGRTRTLLLIVAQPIGAKEPPP